MNEADIDNILEDPKSRAATAVIMAGDLELFIKYTHFAVNGVRFTFKPFHIRVIKKLEAIALNKNEKRNLALCLPVGSGKSLLVEYFIAWTFCRNINNAYVYTSHSRTNILKLSREVKDMLEHRFLSTVFGLKLKGDEASKTNWSFEGAINRTGLVATTTGSGSTGADSGNPAIEGYSGAIILDDPIDAGDISSVIKLEEVIRFYDDKLATRRRTPTTPSIVIMQRLCLGDLVGWLKKTEVEQWDFIEVPALNEDGTSFWPERYPVEELNQIRNSNPLKFYSQYQQNPIASDGSAMFKRDKFNFYDTLPEFSKIVDSWDTAFKAKTFNDYSACTIWGVEKGKFGDNYYLIHVWRGKAEYPQLKQKFIEINTKFRPFISLIEDKASGQSLLQDMKQAGNNRLHPVKADNDKESRATAPSSMVENGCVFLPKNATWLNDFLDEVLVFPNGKHDDQVDTMTQFLNWANKPKIGTIGFNV